MKVQELIEILNKLPPETECYLGSFIGFLTDTDQHSKATTDKQRHEVYDLSVELKTVYNYHRGKYIPYTGVIFEAD